MKNKNWLFKLILISLLLVSIPLGVYLMKSETNFIDRALNELLGTRAEFAVNLTDSYEVDQYAWSYLAQGGEEKDGMLAPVVSQVAVLKPDYIRLDHIFDFYEPVKKDAAGNLTFNWTALDSELSSITDTGAKPFISLSYMPSVISSGSEVDTPLNWNEWQLIVQRTIEHISGVDGLGIADVYYEVWNEPDLFGKFKMYGEKNYLTLYEYSARGAEDASNVLPFKFGGPATTALYKSWFDGLFTYAARNNLRLDFYSWHRYAVNIDTFETDVRKAKEWILAHPEFKNIEFIISEAGHDSELDGTYDSAYAAIHTLALSAALFDKNIKIFSFEVKDGPGETQFWGRWGLLTHEKFGIPLAKPRYRALELLNRMKGRRYVVFGQGTWVKGFVTGDNKTVRMLLVNYDPYGKHLENVPVHFVNLPSGNFVYRRNDFLGGVKESSVTITERDWTIHELMQPNSAAILELTFQ